MTIINKAGDYTLALEVTPLKRPQGHYNVEFLSNYSSARFPNEWRRVSQATVNASGLEEIGRTIYEALRKNPA